MTYNLMHLAAMLTASGGIPVGGNQSTEWDKGRRWDLPTPNNGNLANS